MTNFSLHPQGLNLGFKVKGKRIIVGTCSLVTDTAYVTDNGMLEGIWYRVSNFKICGPAHNGAYTFDVDSIVRVKLPRGEKDLTSTKLERAVMSAPNQRTMQYLTQSKGIVIDLHLSNFLANKG
jgi:hypothetical protein